MPKLICFPIFMVSVLFAKEPILPDEAKLKERAETVLKCIIAENRQCVIDHLATTIDILVFEDEGMSKSAIIEDFRKKGFLFKRLFTVEGSERPSLKASLNSIKDKNIRISTIQGLAPDMALVIFTWDGKNQKTPFMVRLGFRYINGQWFVSSLIVVEERFGG